MNIYIRPPVLGPIVKGSLGDATSSVLRIWMQGLKTKRGEKSIIIGRVRRLGNEIYEGKNILIQVLPNNNYIGIIEFTGLNPGTIYEYNVGCYVVKKKTSNYMNHIFDWTNSLTFSAKTSELTNDIYSLKSWGFVYGSCRYHLKLGPKTMFRTGSDADKVYKAVKDVKPDFFMSIGDQVYLDPMGSIGRYIDIDDIRSLYKKVFSFKNFANLTATTPTYFICDDHDIHRNDTNWEARNNDRVAWANGLQAYREFQHINGPVDNGELYYSFDWNNATFFVIDTRSERDERIVVDGKPKKPTILSDHQINAVKEWSRDPENYRKIKFLVSPTPVISQTSQDSFNGFPHQQAELVNILLDCRNTESDYQNVFILAGDAHCSRLGTYTVSNGQNHIGKITEIISSGFVSIAHDKGRPFSAKNGDVVDIDKYDEANDFPFVIDNVNRGGLCFQTEFSTCTFPEPKDMKKPTLLRKFTSLAKLTSIESAFVKVCVDDVTASFEIYNQDGVLEHSIDKDNLYNY